MTLEAQNDQTTLFRLMDWTCVPPFDLADVIGVIDVTLIVREGDRVDRLRVVGVVF